MTKSDFKAVTIEELISYSKQKEVPAVVIIDDVSDEDFKYVDVIAERLKLRPIIVENTNMVAFIDNSNVSLKIAKDLKKRCQKMYYDYFKRPSGSITIFALTGYTKNWTVLRDNGYIVKAYDETATETEPWIDTDIENVEPTHLNSLGLSIYEFSVYLRGKGESGNVTILKYSRSNFANGGIYNKQRKCYYPSGTSNKEIAETNKLNKLFMKWGFKSL